MIVPSLYFSVRRFTLRLLLLFVSLLPTTFCLAEDGIDYSKQIKPIFAARCIACHGILKQEAGLRLDTGQLARRGSDEGGVIVPHEPLQSRLLGRVQSNDPVHRMPPEGEGLTEEQIGLLKGWIATGAISPEDEQPEKDPREHWSFRPIVRPILPLPQNIQWQKNPVDTFVASRHEQLGLTPQSEASRSELIRRLYFDLIGIPPSLEELEALNTDRNEDWYERLVNRLLEDPRHGERWARHWMDIWRYSDWWGLGEQLRNSQQHMWHWRDWIVESLNANLPYDEMVRQMLAADELYPTDTDKLRATGFLARNFFLFNRNQWMDETVEHVSKGFLGLTVNCAKCHDHKYDPIAQVDYYAMRAFFEPYHVRLDLIPGQVDLSRDGLPRIFDGAIETPTYLFNRGEESQPDKSKIIPPSMPDIFAFRQLEIRPVSLPLEAWQPERQRSIQESYLEESKNRIEAANAKLASFRAKEVEEADQESSERKLDLQIAELEAVAAAEEHQSLLKRIDAMNASYPTNAQTGSDGKETANEAEPKRIDAIGAERRAGLTKARLKLLVAERALQKGKKEKKAALEKELKSAQEGLAKAEKRVEEEIKAGDTFSPIVGAKWSPTRFLNSGADDPVVPFSGKSSGRRTALAEWITDDRNPLTARVAVNHLWARHMGSPLVTTTFDFGRKGGQPSQVELIDWLAKELIDSRWDMKKIHRLIVNSATYKMSSTVADRADNQKKDPDNVNLWRRNSVRLESGLLRDSILSHSGALDSKRGGPSIKPSEQLDSKRRSLYFFHSNNERNLFLSTFDEALVKECYRREESIVPQQALALTNSQLVLDSSKLIADRFAKLSDSDERKVDDTTFVQRLFRVLLGFEADEREMNASLNAMEAWRKLATEEGRDPRSLLVWTLLNHNDFVTLR